MRGFEAEALWFQALICLSWGHGNTFLVAPSASSIFLPPELSELSYEDRSLALPPPSYKPCAGFLFPGGDEVVAPWLTHWALGIWPCSPPAIPLSTQPGSSPLDLVCRLISRPLAQASTPHLFCSLPPAPSRSDLTVPISYKPAPSMGRPFLWASSALSSSCPGTWLSVCFFSLCICFS